MLDIISSVFLCVDAVLNLLLAYSLYGKSIVLNLKSCAIVISTTVILVTIGFFTDDKVGGLAPIIVLMLCTKDSLIKRCWITVSTCLFIMITQQIVILVCDPIIIQTYDTRLIQMENLYSTLAILAISGVIKLLKGKLNDTIKFDNIPSYFYPIIATVVISLVMPLIIFSYLSDRFQIQFKVFMMTSSYLSVAFLLIAIYLFFKNNKQKEMYYNENIIKDQLLATQSNYYDSTVKNYEYINSFKHDIQAHIRILKSLEEENNYEELHTYLESLQYEYQKGKIYKCSNVFISALVNSFMMECKNKDIELLVDYSINGNITMNNIHLCSLLHNLLSNAFEAEAKYSNSNKNIKLNIYSLEDDLQIDISNHLEDRTKIDNINNHITTKDNKRDHGIGLFNIQKVIDDYNGIYKTYYQRGVLTISILLQDVVELQ